jgi:hypothetical protein
MKILVAAVTASTLLYGCATFPDYAGADAACVSGAAANPFKGLADAHVAIDAIDGVAGWAGGTYCVRPGRRQVTYRALDGFASSKTQGTAGTVALQMEAGRKYSLRARIVGSTATVQQVDVSDKEPKVVAQFEAQTSDTGVRPTVIMVPVR